LTMQLMNIISWEETGQNKAKWKQAIVRWGGYFTGMICLYMQGVNSITDKNRSVDYSKYLGPDWKECFKGATMTVTNHQSLVDLFVLLVFNGYPQGVAKDSTSRMPLVGWVGNGVGHILNKRGDRG
jgi:1-acyl-sn-glycerol-3-phosphate acyltransferase